jgi:hypothetical protein
VPRDLRSGTSRDLGDELISIFAEGCAESHRARSMSQTEACPDPSAYSVV